ncbi:MAG: hypothetical protein ACKVOL_06835 [Novosphingobium sp.]
MARVEGWIRGPLSAVREMGYCASMLGRLLWRALPVFRRSYHPRRHPLVNDAQNPIQVAWRRFALKDGDVLKLDHARMAQMMNIPEEAALHAA